MRTYGPHVKGQSVPFMMLNRGKRSLALDLKDPREREEALDLIRDADVLVEQFRPGVMESLGLGYQAVKMVNLDIIYCSLTGYGQEGVHARRLRDADDMAFAHIPPHCRIAVIVKKIRPCLKTMCWHTAKAGLRNIRFPVLLFSWTNCLWHRPARC